jgi:hypothetical protein
MKAHDPKVFESYYEPVICQLAVVREAVSLNQLGEWTGLSPKRIADVFRNWHQFLNKGVSRTGEDLFRLYHSSFQDFLGHEVGLAPYHQRIIETALRKVF